MLASKSLETCEALEAELLAARNALLTSLLFARAERHLQQGTVIEPPKSEVRRGDTLQWVAVEGGKSRPGRIK